MELVLHTPVPIPSFYNYRIHPIISSEIIGGIFMHLSLKYNYVYS
jgi:hypothetical protein